MGGILGTNKAPAMAIAGIDYVSGGSGVDASTQSLNFVDYTHHEIHDGNAYSAHYDLTTASADDHRTAIGFKTPAAAPYMHFIASVSASAAAEVFIEEAPTIDLNAGTQLACNNRNRNSTNTSGVRELVTALTANKLTSFTEAQIAAANYSAGTILEHYQLKAGGGPFTVGGSSRGSQEWELKANTIYLVMIKNTAANVNAHSITLDWYEHTDKN